LPQLWDEPIYWRLYLYSAFRELVLIAPFNPPVAVYLATLCPGIGVVIGGTGGAEFTQLLVN